MAKKRAKSKTYWFATALVALGTLEANMPAIRELCGQYYGVIMIVIGVAVAILREYTSESVKNAPAKED